MGRTLSIDAEKFISDYRTSFHGYLGIAEDGCVQEVVWFSPMDKRLPKNLSEFFSGYDISALISQDAESASDNINPRSCRYKNLEFTFSGILASVPGNMSLWNSRIFFVKFLLLKDLSANEYIIEPLYCLNDIITISPQMLQLKKEISLLSNSDSNTLIFGETGTGKKLVAESIHSEGKRHNYPFISQNCAAIPATLLESLLFGVEKGSFTGAETRAGLFELADGGTLFLDEINSMDTELQAKLLNIIEEKKTRRLGGERDHYFDVRLIVATNEVPENLVNEGRMRRDLYYRLNIARISIPPLRERQEDIPKLSKYFVEKLNRKMGRNIKGLKPDAYISMMNYRWPGNVRELENMLESAFNLETGDYISGEIISRYISEHQALADISAEPASSGAFEESSAGNGAGGPSEVIPMFSKSDISKGETVKLERLIKDFEAHIIRTVIYEEKSLSAAARRLEMSPQKLSYRMKILDIRL